DREICGLGIFAARRDIADADLDHPAFLDAQPLGDLQEAYLATFPPHSIGHFFPQLAWAELRIEEAFDQARLGLRRIPGTLGGGHLLERVYYRPGQRQTLDALRAELRADLRARYAPDLFGIRLEESP